MGELNLSLDSRSFPKGYRENLAWRRGILKKARVDLEFRAKVTELFYRNILFAFNAFFYTYDPRKRPFQDLPFTTWDFQDEEVLELAKGIEGGTDVLVEKSRDMGVTWVVIGVFEWFWLKPVGGYDFLMGSRVEDYVDKRGDMRTLFPKARYLLYKLPFWLKPKGFSKRRDDNYMKLLNPESGNMITGESANSNYSTGGRYAGIFFDEFAKWEHDKAAWTASGDASPCRIPVSTPFGAGGQYYDLVTDGKTKRLTYHWARHPEKAFGINCIWPPLNEDERDELGDEWEPEVKLTSPWYESECRRRTSDEIKQELDIDYLGSGNPEFVKRAWRRLMTLHKTTIKPKAFYRIELANCSLEEASKPFDVINYFVVLEPFSKFFSYTIGVDVVEGVEGGDFAVINVFNRDTRNVDASYYSLIDEVDLAKVVVAISNFYSPTKDSFKAPWTGIETPGPGLATFDECDRLGLNNLFVSPRYDTTQAGVSYKKGWRNDSNSRPELIAGIKKWLIGREGICHQRLVGEMMTFVKGKTGKPQAKVGNHDDEVFAFGICLQVDELAPHEKYKEKEKLRSDGLPANFWDKEVVKKVKEPSIEDLCFATAVAAKDFRAEERMFYGEDF